MRFILPIIVISFFTGMHSDAAPKTAPSICTVLNQAVAKGSSSQKLTKYLQAEWKSMMIESPEYATYAGYPGQNDRWSDMSLANIERQEKETACELAALKKIPRKGLNTEEQINFDLYAERLQRSLDDTPFGGKYLQLSHLSGLQMDVVDMMEAMPKAGKKDYENMISRLNKVPELENQIEVLLKEGLQKKITPVRMFLTRVPAQFDRVLTAKVEESPLYSPFKEIHGELSDADKKEIQEKALEAIQSKVYPALQKLKDFVVTQYIPGSRESVSYLDMPNGKAWYASLVKAHTTTNKTPEQLHDLGLREVARLTQEMENLKTQVGFKGDLKAFNKFLLTDAQFYYNDKEELLKGYRDIAKRIDPQLTKLFKTLPRLTYGVREMPEYKAKEAPAAYYEGGNLEAGRPGYFTANTYDLKARPKWGMESLTLHEAVPGHHLQIALAQELKDIPDFRKYGGYTAFIEGWGLYAETLGSEIGLYQDPYSRYGQLTYEIWRSVRLVVDTGIHSKGWTRQQAVDYFMAAMPKTQLEAEVEVDRYITWPGQALAYKVGQLKFRELRDKARADLGDKFDVREFHDQVLKHGALPLDVLEKSIVAWIASEKKKK